MESAFLLAVQENPSDDSVWLVLSDWLEENNQPRRAELVRLQIHLRHDARIRGRAALETRVQELLADNTRPAVPGFTNSLGMDLALIPPGVFLMGTQRARTMDRDEQPRHEVEITRPFYLGVHHVTQEQYERIMG